MFCLNQNYCRWLANCSGLLIFIMALVAGQAAEELKQYHLKAAFLFKFTTFVKWPPTAFAKSNSPLVIGVLGKARISAALQKLVKNRKVQGRKIEVIRLRPKSNFTQCHVVYIGQSEKAHLAEALSLVAGHSVLTVSETERFLENGGMINLIVRNKQVGFEINADNLARVHLKPAWQLLDLAERVIQSKSKT